MTKDEALKMALKVLENVPIEYDFHGKPMDAEFGEQLETTLQALRQALAQPEQEPVKEHDKVDLRCECCGYMTYHREHLGCIRAAAPPSKPEQGCCECGVTVSEGYALYCVKCVEPMFKKEWVSLTDEDIQNSEYFCGDVFFVCLRNRSRTQGEEQWMTENCWSLRRRLRGIQLLSFKVVIFLKFVTGLPKLFGMVTITGIPSQTMAMRCVWL